MKLFDLFRNVFEHCEELEININFRVDEDDPESYSIHLSHNDGSSGVVYNGISSTKQLEYILEDYLESNLN